MDRESGAVEEYLKNAEERLEAAKALKDAEKYNDAISRVYYAFFDATKAALISRGFSAKTHHGLIVLFEKNFIKTGEIKQGVGRWLRRAKEAREEADYEIYKRFDKETVSSGMKAAEEFIAEIKKLIRE
jgi:uncharacterized protein (UPF0332 family)